MLIKDVQVYLKKWILSGIKSNNDRNSITEEAKEIPPIKKFKLFFLDKNIIKDPIKVERPAREDRTKAIVVFILSP